MKLDVAAVNQSGGHIAVTYSNVKCIRAVLEVVHVHGKAHTRAPGDFGGAGKSPVISGYLQTGDLLGAGAESETSRRVGVAEGVVNPPAWLLNMEAEASLTVVVNRDGSGPVNLGSGSWVAGRRGR